MKLNKYETVIIVNGNLSEAAANKIARKYIKICEEWAEPVKTIDDKSIIPVYSKELGKKKLAYEIKRQTEAYYYIIEFYSESKNIAELDRLLRIDDDILKFITTKMCDKNTHEEIILEINDTPELKTEQKEQSRTPVGDNHYDYLLGYTDELK